MTDSRTESGKETTTESLLGILPTVGGASVSTSDIFEAMDQGILVADPSTRVVQWNRRALELLDVPESLLLSQPTHAEVMNHMASHGAFLPGEIEALRDKIESWLRQPEDRRGALIYERTRPDGLVMEVRTTPLPGGGYVRTLTDITQRKRAEERLATQRSLLDTTLGAMNQGIILVNRDQRVLLHNACYMKLLELPPFLFRDRKPLISEILAYQYGRGDFGAEFERMPEDMRGPMVRGNPFTRMTYERTMTDGRILAVDTFALADGGHVRTFTDITEARRAEREVRRAKDTAEEALAQLTATQETLLVTEKLASLGQLVAGIAHEINTPIGTGLTAASLLAEKTEILDKALAAGQLKRSQLDDYAKVARDSTGFILSNLTRAAELIQSFKQVSVDQTSDERRGFVLGDYLEEIITSLRPRINRSPHDLILDCPEGLEMDSRPGALFRVITNLVMNALTHGLGEEPDAPPGEMRLSARPDGADHVVLSFSDNGAGIDPEHLSRIFDPFFTTKRGKGGTGLGLNIVHNLVTQTLEGAITARSQPGEGTTFVMRLPLVLSPSDP